MTPEQVALHLGDKVVNGLASAVVSAAQDLAEYRRVLPGAVARSSNRGLANWIHDAIRARVLAHLDGMTEVSFSEQEPHFDVFVTTPEGIVFRIRCKRHSGTGRIANYRTQGALDFVTQPDDLLSLAGVRFVHLCVGYEWDADSRSMTGPVMSLRDGSFDDVVWMTDLAAPGDFSAGDNTTPIVPGTDSPSLPAIELPGRELGEEEGVEGS